jgi:hypothetical protein
MKACLDNGGFECIFSSKIRHSKAIAVVDQEGLSKKPFRLSMGSLWAWVRKRSEAVRLNRGQGGKNGNAT